MSFHLKRSIPKHKSSYTKEQLKRKADDFIKQIKNQDSSRKIFNITIIIGLAVPFLCGIYAIIIKCISSIKDTNFSPSPLLIPYAIIPLLPELIALCLFFFYAQTSKLRKNTCIVLTAISLIASIAALISISLFAYIIYVVSINSIPVNLINTAAKAPSIFKFAIFTFICALAAATIDLVIIYKTENSDSYPARKQARLVALNALYIAILLNLLIIFSNLPALLTIIVFAAVSSFMFVQLKNSISTK